LAKLFSSSYSTRAKDVKPENAIYPTQSQIRALNLKLLVFERSPSQNPIPGTLSLEREQNKVFEMLAQIQHKQKHGTSNSILSNPQRFSSTIDEDVKVEENSNSHSNNTSFSLWLESVGLVDNCDDSSRWDVMFKLLLEFKQKHGHFKIPCYCDSEIGKLGIWAINRRRDYREYKRTNGQKGDPERMKHMEYIGLVDDLVTGYEKGGFQEIWYSMYSQLLEFKQKHGHVKVPQQYYENKKLGRWVTTNRGSYREYKQTNGQKGDPERMKHLESIGLVDDITIGYAKGCVKQNWYGMYNQLLEFKQKHGHLTVPQRYKENKKLGRWVNTWRSAYREYKRTDGQKGDPVLMENLESIGLFDDITTWYAKEGIIENWYDMYNQLFEFKQKHGHVKVPQRCDKNKKLGRWVGYWRSNYREYKRTNGQKGDPVLMENLESIGLVDDILFKIHHGKMTNCTNVKVSAPIIASSTSPTCSPYTQTITKEIPLLVGMKGEEENGDNSGGVNHTQADSHFLGSELRGKGGFWV
jgi:hypothetical protein